MKKLICLFFLPLFLFAEISTVSVKAVGFGNSYSEAVKNALINAIGEVKGINIDAKKAFQKNLSQLAISVNSSSNKIVKINDSIYSQVISATKGFVKKFRILNVRKLSPYEYKATIIAYFSSYKTPGFNPKNRRSLAVIPFEYKKIYYVNNFPINGSDLSKLINQMVVTKITQTRKFTVLDRENNEYYNYEKNFLLSGNSAPEELSRLGKRLGADYFIIGKILDFSIKKIVSHNDYTGENYVTYKGFATISYRILCIATQQIKWADTFNLNFNLKPSNRIEVLISEAADKIAQKITNEIIFNIYPPKIIMVRGKIGIINMGGNFIHKGEIYNVYALGKTLIDPYTHEFLGRDELYIGTVKITKVLPKISYITLLRGKLKLGAILRKVKSKNKMQYKNNNIGKDSMFDAIFHK